MYKCDSSVWRIGFWNVLVRHWPSGWKPSGLDRAGGQSASLGFSNCCSVGNGKEWGLLGWLLIVWIIPENSLRLAPVRFCFHRFFFLMAAMTLFGESTRPGQRRIAVPSASCPAETTAPWWGVIFCGMMGMFEAEFSSKHVQKKKTRFNANFFLLYI